ncbi:hypothetical protein ABBQ38_006655 [Trebouxia sp. C0009 RCD-2024]
MPACYRARNLPETDRPSTYVEAFKRPNTAAIQEVQQAAFLAFSVEPCRLPGSATTFSGGGLTKRSPTQLMHSQVAALSATYLLEERKCQKL